MARMPIMRPRVKARLAIVPLTLALLVAGAAGSSSGAGKPGEATGDLSGVGVAGLTVDGVPAGAGRIPLGDWGYADVNVQSSAPTATTFHGFVTALDVHLTADHGGLPAGSEIQVGYAEASVQAPPKAPPPKPAPKPRQSGAD